MKPAGSWNGDSSGSEIDAHKLLQTLLEGTGEWAVLIINREAKIELVNSLTPVLLGVPSEQLLGGFYFDIVPLLDLDGKPLSVKERPTYKILHEGLRQIQPFFCLYQVPGQQKPITIALRTVRVPGPEKTSNTGAVVYMREARRQFDPKSIDRSFVSFAAHQLKTPAGVVQGFLEIVLRSDPKKHDPVARHYITAAYEANLSLIRSAKDLLNSAKLRGGLIEPEVKPFDLSETIDKKLVGYEQWVANKQVRLTVSHNMGDNPVVHSDKRIVAELFDILLHNALKFVPKGGLVEVLTARRGSFFEISVCDSGPGLRRENTAAEENDPAADGTGMGLRVAHQYAALLKGKIIYKPLEPAGSCFVLELPDFS